MQVSPNRLVVHLTCGALPWMTGGREVYALALARELKKLDWESLIVLHQNPGIDEPIGRHVHDGIAVEVLPPLLNNERSQYYSYRPNEIPGFRELLQKSKPTVVHYHDYSIGANLLHLDAIREARVKTLMTIHSPGQSCLQREMLYKGTTPCDGEIKLDRCTACRLGVIGIPSWLSWPLSKVTLPELGNNMISRALSSRKMTSLFASAFQEMVQKIDGIHVLSQWVKDVFTRNHVPEEKLALIRSGLTFDVTSRPAFTPKQEGGTLKLVMVGRCDPIKGQEILIDAVQQMDRSHEVHVTFIGPYWDNTDYGKRCLHKIEGDTRFSKPQLLPHSEVPVALSQADALVIPSTWFENAPLVVLEAQAYGLPVIGSRLGGIPELVKDGATGLLFTVGDAKDLRRCIETIYRDRGLLQQFHSQIAKPRMMSDVAADTARIYESLVP